AAVVDPANKHDDLNEDDLDPDLVSQIAARFGSLYVAPDGKLRYFGTASNAHLFGHSKGTGMGGDARSVRLEGQRLLRSAGLDRTIDPSFEQQLLEKFFTCHNSVHYIIDEAAYWLARRQVDNSGEYQSEVLTNAMFVQTTRGLLQPI
ncbi:MAG TPA: hypothetical protein VHV10_11380, partial [Ktedonobacteraceae bacterium]|nr:hypothetical protein [Ktedonobacteraceae bacterium]